MINSYMIGYEELQERQRQKFMDKVGMALVLTLGLLTLFIAVY